MALKSISTVKRQRSENWLEEDKVSSDTPKIGPSFNNMARTPRTLQQIKAQWGIIKMTEKKKKCLERKKILQTGGGPPPATDPPTGDDIAVWLPHEFTVDSNEFDSDNQLTINKIDKPEPPILISLCENAEPEIEMMSQPGTSTKTEHNTPTNNLLMSQTSTPDKPQITTTTTPPMKKLKSPNYYKVKNKKIYNGSASAALQISETEIACRKELHEMQMANERQKLKNLLLKEEVLKCKLDYYKKN
ncbi:hypothetical protein RR48_03581 [Papilio machaon]|uniref:Regulatory protein zeste n=1 Tax=Papilio machaon TaxID=76193 RepID=A0A0N0PBR3_PAPMA|nr:hypothetical protein RR48_03581 [Papilio machaon]